MTTPEPPPGPSPALPPPPPGQASGHPRTETASAEGPPPADESVQPFDERERRLDPRIVRVWRLVTGLSLGLPLGAASIVPAVLVGRSGWLAPAGVVVVLAVLAGWHPRARYERWRWQFTPIALELRHGVIVHRHESIPYFRIQQIDVARGPLDRLVGLATLQVTTAAHGASLPGLPADEAPRVRAELLARAAEAVAEHAGELRDAV